MPRWTETYRRSTLEDDGVLPRAWRVCKRTHGLCRFILVCRKEVVEPLVASLVQEPLAVRMSTSSTANLLLYSIHQGMVVYRVHSKRGREGLTCKALVGPGEH
jgi:hypothetical protein